MQKKLLLVLMSLVLTCGAWALNQVNNVYQIGTAQDLVDFASLVNSGTTKAAAVLTADIDMSDVTDWTPIGDWSSGSVSSAYCGTFDGQGHNITNLNFTVTANYKGLFGVASAGADIKNFNIYGDITVSSGNSVGVVGYVRDTSVNISHVQSYLNITSTAGDPKIGGIVGTANTGTANIDCCAYHGTMTMEGEKGSNTHGGIIGYLNSSSAVIVNITNCIFDGTLQNNSTGACNIGGFVGYSNGGNYRIKNCLSAGTLSSDVYGTFFGTVKAIKTFSGNYTLGTPALGSTSTVSLTATEVTEDQLASGEITYALNGNQNNIMFYQTLSDDAIPTLDATHKQVYVNGNLRCDGTPLSGGSTYSNSISSDIPDHKYVNGICSVCGSIKKDYMTAVDGYFMLGTANDLNWFVGYANNYDNNANAKLTADIDMAGAMDNFSMLKSYGGTFDGQNHKISNFVLNETANNVGFISTANNNMHLCNIIFDSSCSITTDGSYAGLVGYTVDGITGTITFTKVGNEGSVTAGGINAGGILGCNCGSVAYWVFDNCYVTGKVKGAKESAAIAGWAGKVGITVRNCWVAADVEGYDSEDYYLLRLGKTPSFTNVYTTKGSQKSVTVTKVNAEDVASGALCWKMNGNSFLDAQWYQTLNADDHPSFDSTHGLVYLNDENTYASVSDQNSYDIFSNSQVQIANNYCNDLAACQSLMDEYQTKLTALLDCQTLDEYLQAYRSNGVPETIAALNASATYYAEYKQVCEDAITTLKNNVFAGKSRDFLETYLTEDVEPGDDYPNGSYSYVYSNHTLDDAGIQAETAYADSLLKVALAGGYVAGNEVTDLMVNPDLKNKYEGWNFAYQTGSLNWGGVTEIMNTGELYKGTMDMSQTLKNMKGGVYMLKVNAAFRPYADVTGTLYDAQLYLNNNVNFAMVEGEDFVSKSDAQDGVNCHITGSNTDYSYIYGSDEGWVPMGPLSCSYAFNAGRYVNYTAIKLADGDSLTIGLKSPGTGQTGDWLGFGNFHLYYLGTTSEANGKLTAVLNGYKARAQVLLDFMYSDMDDYAKYPNFSQADKDALTTAINKIATAATGEQKMALIDEFSRIFADVYDCRKAYIEMVDKAEAVRNLGESMVNAQLISEDEYTIFYNKSDEGWNNYSTGSVSTEEAKAFVAATNTLLSEHMPVCGEDGYYNLATARDLQIFSVLANYQDNKANGRLTADIDMSEVTAWTPIGNWNTGDVSSAFCGIFDGQGHSITNLNFEVTDNYKGLFGAASAGADIKNFSIYGTITATSGKYIGVIGYTKGTSVKISNVQSYLNYNITASDPQLGGIVGTVDIGSTYIDHCGYHGTMTMTGTNGGSTYGGIVGYVVNATSAYNTITNSLFDGVIDKQSTGSCTCGGFVSYSNGGSNTIKNCLSVGTINTDNYGMYFGTIKANPTMTNNYQLGSAVYGASNSTVKPTTTSVTSEQLASGEIAYKLNGESDQDPQWYQTLGEDAHPVLDSTHGLVKKNAEGGYYNGSATEKGDVNADGIIDGSDLVAMVNMVISGGYDTVADLDENGIVDGSDVVSLVVKITSGDIKEFSGVFHFAGKKYTVNKGVITVTAE